MKLKTSFQSYTARTFQSQTGSLNYRIYSVKKESKRPLIVFLHGAGERGNDNEKQLFWAGTELIEKSKALNENPVIVFPQCPENSRWAETDWSLKQHTIPERISKPLDLVHQLIKSLIQTEEIDTSRIYLMGISMGGFGVWDYACRFPDELAAIIPICGGVDVEQLYKLKTKPIWIFHGLLDEVVWSIRSQEAFKKLKELGSKSVLYTEYPDLAHNCWSKTLENDTLFKWLFEQKMGV